MSIEGKEDNESLEFLLGLSLVLGFVFMLVVDQCGSHSHSSGTGMRVLHCIPCRLCMIVDVETASVRRKGGVTVTVGLVVHAAGTNKTLCTL